MKSFKEHIHDESSNLPSGYPPLESEPHKEKVAALRERLVAHYHAKPLAPEHISCIAAHTNDSYDVNTYLWRKAHAEGTPMEEEDRRFAKHIRLMDETLSHHHAPEAFPVYTGLKKVPEKGEHIYHHPAYLSTSTSHEIATHFASDQDVDVHRDGVPGEHRDHVTATKHKHVMRIMVPFGHPSFFPGHLSKYENEHEVMLPRGLKLRIDHSKEEIKVGRYEGDTPPYTKYTNNWVHHIHHAEIVGEDE